MKEFINVAHVTGIANGRVIEGESSACVVKIKPCPPKQGICKCKRICKRIQLNGSNVLSFEDCIIRVISKAVRNTPSGRAIIVEYSICVIYRDSWGNLQKVSTQDSTTFYDPQGNVVIENVSVRVTNPPRVITCCNGLQIHTKITVEF